MELVQDRHSACSLSEHPHEAPRCRAARGEDGGALGSRAGRRPPTVAPLAESTAARRPAAPRRTFPFPFPPCGTIPSCLDPWRVGGGWGGKQAGNRERKLSACGHVRWRYGVIELVNSATTCHVVCILFYSTYAVKGKSKATSALHSLDLTYDLRSPFIYTTSQVVESRYVPL